MPQGSRKFCILIGGYLAITKLDASVELLQCHIAWNYEYWCQPILQSQITLPQIVDISALWQA